jgi:hypothetical protein
VVGFGCTTCIGNSGPLHPQIEEAIKKLFEAYDDFTESYTYYLDEQDSPINLFSKKYGNILLLEFIFGKLISNLICTMSNFFCIDRNSINKYLKRTASIISM